MLTEFQNPGLPQKSIHVAIVIMLVCCGSMLFGGCRSSASYAKLEQELRGKEAQIRDVEARLAESEAQLQTQDQQLAAHRIPAEELPAGTQFAMVSQSQAASDGALIPEEVLAAWGSVEAIKIQKLVSGIQWDSGQPVLHVVVRPVDAEGELCKVAGQLSLQATPLSGARHSDILAEQSWSITESRDLWSKGFVSSGFHVRIPIADEQAAKQASQLHVTATLRLGKGRTFEVSETLNLPRVAK